MQWSQFEVKPSQRPLFGPVETADGYVMLAVAQREDVPEPDPGGRSSRVGLRSALCHNIPDRRDHWEI